VTGEVPRSDFRVAFAVASEIGKRKSLEDRYLLAPEVGLFAVADGVGGHVGGEVAAELALRELKIAMESAAARAVIEAYVAAPDRELRHRVFGTLRAAFARANAAIFEHTRANPSLVGMATTLDAVWLARDHAFVAHAGDGRVYLARDTAVLQLTQDHAHGETLKAEGALRPSQKNPLFERLVNGIGLAEQVQVDTLFVDLAPGNRLLLSTDGAHDPIVDEGMLARLLRGGAVDEAPRRLLDTALQRGRDNATAVVIEIGERLVHRADSDRGLSAEDLEKVCTSALLSDLKRPLVLQALAAAVEIELEPAAIVPRVVTSDLTAYIVLDGIVRVTGNRRVSTGALLFAESLVGVWVDGELPVVEERARLLRWRAHDFDEVAGRDAALGAELYKRIAKHVARTAAKGLPPTPMPSLFPGPAEPE